MVGVHIAHDCILGDNIVMANYATLGGHVEIANTVIFGGFSAIHQFSKAGIQVIDFIFTKLMNTVFCNRCFKNAASKIRPYSPLGVRSV